MDIEGWKLLNQVVEAAQAIVLAWIGLKMYQMRNLPKTMETLEKNTNSIKDELVAVTKKSAHAEGVLDEKTRQGQEG